MLNNAEKTLEVVQKIDDSVGLTMMSESIEKRIAYAQENSKTPWQFCFILSGGWKRSKAVVDAARANGDNILLALIAIKQIVSKDASLSLHELSEFLEENLVEVEDIQARIKTLIQERILLKNDDIRFPHQRFAASLLITMMKEATLEQNRLIIKVIENESINSSNPLGGIRHLLHTVFFDARFSFSFFMTHEDIKPLLERCWCTPNSRDRGIACAIIRDFLAYAYFKPDSFYKQEIEENKHILIKWFLELNDQYAYGLSYLINDISNYSKEAASAIVAKTDANALAKKISRATIETIWDISQLIDRLHVCKEEQWKSEFVKAIEYDRLLLLAKNWRADDSLESFTACCVALYGFNQSLTLQMVEEASPIIQHLFSLSPLATFSAIQDITWHILRTFDVLGIYQAKKDRPSVQQRKTSANLLNKVDPQKIALILSETKLRDFQTLTFFLAFVQKTSQKKFHAIIENIDWKRIAFTISSNWNHIPHEVEILFCTSFSSQSFRPILYDLIDSNLDKILVMPPKIAFLVPELAMRQIEQGRTIGIENYGHVQWEESFLVLVYFYKNRPDLITQLMQPHEEKIGLALSKHSSFYNESNLFLQILYKYIPSSLERILNYLDVKKLKWNGKRAFKIKINVKNHYQY